MAGLRNAPTRGRRGSGSAACWGREWAWLRCWRHCLRSAALPSSLSNKSSLLGASGTVERPQERHRQHPGVQPPGQRSHKSGQRRPGLAAAPRHVLPAAPPAQRLCRGPGHPGGEARVPGALWRLRQARGPALQASPRSLLLEPLPCRRRTAWWSSASATTTMRRACRWTRWAGGGRAAAAHACVHRCCTWPASRCCSRVYWLAAVRCVLGLPLQQADAGASGPAALAVHPPVHPHRRLRTRFHLSPCRSWRAPLSA